MFNNHRRSFARTSDPAPSGPQIIMAQPQPMILGLGGKGGRKHTNHIYFSSDVDPDSISDLCDTIHEMTSDLLGVAQEFGQPVTPIHLHINSGGGDVFSGVQAVETIRRNKVPVWTYVEGIAASASSLIAVAGHRRFIGEMSQILIHQIRGWASGTLEEQKDNILGSQLLEEQAVQFYLAFTKMEEGLLRKVLLRDLFIPAHYAVKYGFVDEVVPLGPNGPVLPVGQDPFLTHPALASQPKKTRVSTTKAKRASK